MPDSCWKKRHWQFFLFLFLLGFFTHFSKITVLRTGSGWLPNSGFSWCMVQLGLFIVMDLEILGWNSPIRGTLMRTQKFLCLVVEASPPPAILLYSVQYCSLDYRREPIHPVYKLQYVLTQVHCPSLLYVSTYIKNVTMYNICLCNMIWVIFHIIWSPPQGLQRISFLQDHPVYAFYTNITWTK